jgi:hypothetical protein
MKLILRKNKLPDTPFNILRGAGYSFHQDRKMNKDSFVRRITGNRYPRLHLYVDESKEDRVVFDLHLDQKQISYQGSRMHNAEHDGEVVEGEINRLKNHIVSLIRNS